MPVLTVGGSEASRQARITVAPERAIRGYEKTCGT